MAAPMVNMFCFRNVLVCRSFAVSTCAYHSRMVHVTAGCYGKSKVFKMMRKTDRYLAQKIETREPKRKHWYESAGAMGKVPDMLRRPRGPSQGAHRRAKQLGVMFYEYITSMINSGEVEPELVDLGVEIVKVKVALDFTVINVHWLASGSDKDDHIQAVLHTAAPKLRSALIGLHLMGNLPPVQFVKDLSATKLEQVEHLLQNADMGPDFEPTELGADMKTFPPSKYPYRDTSLQKRLDNVAQQMDIRDVSEKYGTGVRQVVSTQSSGSQTNPEEIPEGDFNVQDTEPITEAQSFGGKNVNEIVVTHCADERIKDNETFPELNLRSDMYDVDHGSLTKQVLHAKLKARDRYYDRDENCQPSPSIGLGQLSHENLQKFITKKKRWKEKSKDKEQYLSAFAHIEEADRGDEYETTEDFQDDDYWFEDDDDKLN